MSTQARKPSKNPLVQRQIIDAYGAMRSGDPSDASAGFLRAWKLSDGDMSILKLCGEALIELGERNQVFALLEDAISRYGQTEAISLLMGQLATRMQLPDIAEKAFQAAISSNPNEPAHYVNLAQAMAKNGRADDAVSLLQQVIPIFENYAPLWNAVGAILRDHLNKGGQALVFFDHATRLDPKNVNALINLAAGQEGAEAIALLERALELSPGNNMAHISLALEHLALGNFAAAWPHYEYRLDSNSSDIRAPRYTNKIKRWSGKPLGEKTLFLMAEQGIGDEVFFAINFNALAAQAKGLVIGCDPRLASVYQRSFPAAKVVEFEDSFQEGYRYRSFPAVEETRGSKKTRPDCAIPIGSVPQYIWSRPDQIPSIKEGYLKACPEKTAHYGRRLLPYDDRLKVGISWRSGKLEGHRQFGYFGIEGLCELNRLENAVFVCLQYGADSEEIAMIRQATGLEIIVFDDVDLKDDIEANLAIMQSLDLVVGPNVATQMFAMASGRPTWMATWGRPWWAIPERDGKKIAFAPECRFYALEKNMTWKLVMGALVDDANKQFAENRQPR